MTIIKADMQHLARAGDGDVAAMNATVMMLVLPSIGGVEEWRSVESRQGLNADSAGHLDEKMT